MAQRPLIVKHDADSGALLLLAQVGAWCMVVRPGYVPFVMSASEFHARGNAGEEGQRRARWHMDLIDDNEHAHPHG